MTTTTATALRTIAARLCLSAESQVDGRMVLALAEDVGRMESRLTEVDESEEEYLLAMNDFLNATQERVNRITARRKLPVDGEPNDQDQTRPKVCSNCGAPATARIVERGEECDYGFVCDSCKTHPAVRKWRPLGLPNDQALPRGWATKLP